MLANSHWKTLKVEPADFPGESRAISNLVVEHDNIVHVTPHRVSIALRPVQNLTGDSSKDYIAEGLTEELVTRIASNNPALIVMPRASVPEVSGATPGQVTNGSQTGYLLEGSLRESPGRFRITMKLMRRSANLSGAANLIAVQQILSVCRTKSVKQS